MAIAIAEGRPAPNFSLPDAEGRTVSLADFRGRDVVVYFYPKDDTPGCTKEACGFRDHWNELQKAGVVVRREDPSLLLVAHMMQGGNLFFRGDFAGAQAHAEGAHK
jgi:hypothetical protein